MPPQPSLPKPPVAKVANKPVVPTYLGMDHSAFGYRKTVVWKQLILHSCNITKSVTLLRPVSCRDTALTRGRFHHGEIVGHTVQIDAFAPN